jgi:DNA-directed RNA polymerase specialized sigma24 family protein
MLHKSDPCGADSGVTENIVTAGPEENPSGDRRAFRHFLEWLDEGTDSGGQKYLEMHRRLVSYFDRKNCSSPQDLADETLSRVARRLQEEGTITGATPAHYCYIVARFVFLEHHRKPAPLPAEAAIAQTPDSSAAQQAQRLTCLEQCLSQLEPDQRELILGYYQGDLRLKIGLRRSLAARLGLTMNALSIRACRIRDRLEACVRSCSAPNQPDVFWEFPLI